MIPQSNPADVIPVREDERFDETAVAHYLKDKLAGADQPLTVHQFGGGAANLTYLLDYGTYQYVLRRPPLGPVAKSAHDMGREYKVLSVLHQALPQAPRAFLYYDGADLIGAPFIVMERRQGIVVRRSIPSAYASHPQATYQMSQALVETLADFHSVDYNALGLADLGKPEGFIKRQVEGWNGRWHKAKTEDLPDMDTIYQWLVANAPATSEFSLVHNDYKLDNVMLAQDDPSQLVAIFDWDMCTLGDPLSDLGSLLTYWTEPTDPPYMQLIAPMPVGNLGFMSRAELVERYAEKRGTAVHHVPFYHALGLFRLAVIIAQIYIRYQRGQTKDARFAQLGQLIPLIARAANEVAQTS